MARELIVEELNQTPVEKQGLEIVERKGLGHPDTICDLIFDRVAVELDREYRKRVGETLHFNVDKSLLVAGEVQTRFGGGEIKKPMLLVFGDRATSKVDEVEIPVAEIAVRTAKEWFSQNLRFVSPERHVKYQVEIRPGSASLTDLFKRKTKVMGANDTSAAVGYAPLSRLERLVLEVEKYANSPSFKKTYPESGEDIKVMGVRRGEDVHLTIGMAFVDRFVRDEEDYFRKKAEILEELERFVRERFDFKGVKVDLNTLDARGRGESGVYLTVLGTSADGADSGQVGRGNRSNGVIPLTRPMGSEAAAGKNPVSHVGKIYNLLTHVIAKKIHEEVPGITEVYVWLVSQIGRPIDQPSVALARVLLEKGTKMEEVRKEVLERMEWALDHISDFCQTLAEGKMGIC
ncbi:MAG: methionine adenosyltransferase [Hadesarchaea archaeon]|nr:MAG: methionine adenosyltransferase [Hadesarchaea archaeon]